MKNRKISGRQDIRESAVEYSDAFKKELDKRHSDYKNRKAKMPTAAESKKRIQQLKSGRRK